MINLLWGSSFKRAYKKMIKAKPYLRDKISQCLELFVNEPFHPSLNTHKLSGKLKGFWAFVVEYDCRNEDAFFWVHQQVCNTTVSSIAREE